MKNTAKLDSIQETKEYSIQMEEIIPEYNPDTLAKDSTRAHAG